MSRPTPRNFGVTIVAAVAAMVILAPSGVPAALAALGTAPAHASSQQLQTPAEREAVDGRDDWLLRRLDGVDDGRKVRRAGWR